MITPEGVLPPDAFKGPIARSVLYSVGVHPKFAETINDQVLDLGTAIKWDSLFPITKAEMDWIDSIR